MLGRVFFFFLGSVFFGAQKTKELEKEWAAANTQTETHHATDKQFTCGGERWFLVCGLMLCGKKEKICLFAGRSGGRGRGRRLVFEVQRQTFAPLCFDALLCGLFGFGQRQLIRRVANTCTTHNKLSLLIEQGQKERRGQDTPSSVMMPVMYLAGVTSNAGLYTGQCCGATDAPSIFTTSSRLRSCPKAKAQETKGK
jgi:hypothetical protein